MLPLELIAQEPLTITTGDIPITPALFSNVNILMAVFSHDAGGKIWHSTIQSSISNTGGNGETPEVSGTKWEIWGVKDLKAWLAKKDSGVSDATVQVSLYGGP